MHDVIMSMLEIFKNSLATGIQIGDVSYLERQVVFKDCIYENVNQIYNTIFNCIDNTFSVNSQFRGTYKVCD